MVYIQEEFNIGSKIYDLIQKMKPMFGYNGFGELVYNRTYSRIMTDDFGESIGQERWNDTVLRVVEGIITIRKDWYVKNHIHWREDYWRHVAEHLAISLFRMEWLPPGRGLWAMGTDLLRERGSMALYNCAFTKMGEDYVNDAAWLMDSLMYGVGVGFRPYRNNIKAKMTRPWFAANTVHVIDDTREAWVESVRVLLNAFYEGSHLPTFDYSRIRKYGEPIKTFGGQASGPQPLIDLHVKLTELSYKFIDDDDYDEITYKTDICNLIGKCVVSGNVRRSAEIALCEVDDPVFSELKNYNKYPERAEWGWMSNNSILLSKPEDFSSLGDIAFANTNGHDVGFLNMMNIKRGRIGKDDGLRTDHAIGINPCGEIPLEDKEVCNISETLPTRCLDHKTWYNACRFATIYCTTVALLPTHQPATNAVVGRNRRIGISIIDYTGWIHNEQTCNVTTYLRNGYNVIRKTNKDLSDEAGVPEAIRVTTMKPGGTVPKLPGKTSGAGYPTFEETIRRINIGVGTPVDLVLQAAGLRCEPSVYTPNTNVYEYPIKQGPAKPATEISLWQQAMNVVLLQREWADNAISNTLYFKPKWVKVRQGTEGDYLSFEEVNMVNIRYKDGWLERYDPNHEEDQLESVLSAIAPLVKSISVLPHSAVGIFPQMPEEGISVEEYNKRVAELPVIDWKLLSNSDGQDEKFCTGDACVLNI